MEIVLVSVTVVSLVLATGLAAVSWKLMRDAQRFGAARVEALVALARANDFAATLSELPLDAATRSASRPLNIDLSDATLFGAGVTHRSHPRLAFAMSASAILIVTVMTIGYFTPAGTRALSAVLSVGAAAPVSAPPLELRTLKHSFDDTGNFVVSGSVFDPMGGSALDDVVAVVSLFDETGALAASGRATLATSTLRPGDESSFEVHVPTSATITHYRVGFRRASGETLTHIDKRPAPADGTTPG